MGDLSVAAAGATSGVSPQGGEVTMTGDAGGALLPSPQTSLEPGSVLALVALLTRSHQQDRAESREQAMLEEANLMKEARVRISEMRARADDIRSGAWASGVSQIASGALTAAGGVIKANAASGQLKAESDLAEAQARAGANSAQAAQAESAAKLAEINADWADGVSKVMDGGASGASGAGVILKGQYDASAAEHDTNAEEHQAASDAADRRRQMLQDDVDKANDQIRAVIDFFREMNDADNKAKQSALFRG